MKDDKKGILGLDTAKIFIIVILMISVVAFVGIILLVSLQDTREVTSYTNASIEEIIVEDNGTVNSLAQTPDSGTLSATHKNDTWLSFDGVNDKVDLGVSSNPIKTTFHTNWSVSVWFNFSINPDNKNWIVGNNYQSRMDYGVFLGNGTEGNNNSACAWMTNYTTTDEYNICSTSLNSDEWYYLTAIHNDTDLTIFVNGLLNNTLNNLDKTENFGSGYFGLSGSHNSPYNYNKGIIDEVRVYNRSLNSTEISLIYNSGRQANSSLPTAGLLLWLPLNENSGEDVHSFNQSDF